MQMKRNGQGLLTALFALLVFLSVPAVAQAREA
jgi:hypothetical protein